MLPPSTLPHRALGGTGIELPILGLGGFHFGSAGSAHAAQALLEVALEEGIRFLDNAESYHAGQSERWMGAAIEALGVREDVFLMTKTFALETRSRESAKRHLAESLERLRTDYLDLWQLHSVRTVEDVDRAFSPGGAMEYILDVQRRGVVRHVGVTGHQDPAANLRALAYWDAGVRFDVMQLPLNPADHHWHSFEQQVLPALGERGIGVIGMKSSADGRLLRTGACTADECHRYAWSLPTSVVVVGMERPELVRENAARARAFAPLEGAERRGLLQRVRDGADLPELEPYKQVGTAV